MIRKIELKLALGNIFVCIGIFFASLSLFNLLSDNLKLLISPLLNWFISLYQLIFHKPIEATGINISDNLKNIVSIYFLLGGVSSRAIYPNTNWIVSFLNEHEVVHNSRLREISLIKKPYAKSNILTFLYCLFLWPVVFYRIFKTPIYLATPGMAYKDDKGNYREVYELYSSRKKIPFGENGFDARNVLLIQTFSMAALTAIYLIINNYFITS